MGRNDISEEQLAGLSDIVANHLGLDFPESRWNNLRQGVLACHKESGSENLTGTIEDLLSSPSASRMQNLAKHLTIGETYFFRDHNFYHALEKFIIPRLIKLKSFDNQRIKIWSAGCCTGEEPCSVAMLLDKVIPDLSRWDIQILATDINPEYLKKLKEGTYSSWSFRNNTPEFRNKYFSRTPDGRYRITDRIRNLITPFQFNLAEDVYPSVQYPTGNSDIIICRNVLMYFTPEKAGEVIRRFYHSLSDDGWLIVSSAETSQEPLPGFKPVQFPGVLVYQKQVNSKVTAPEWSSAKEPLPSRLTLTREKSSGISISEHSDSSYTNVLHHTEDDNNTTNRTPNPAFHPDKSAKHNDSAGYIDRTRHFDNAEYSEFTEHNEFTELNESTEHSESIEHNEFTDHSESTEHNENAESYSRSARAYADKGKLGRAQKMCEKAVSRDVLNPSHHYLLGTILEEQKQYKSALAVMKKAIYLDRNFILAHVMAGNISLRLGLKPDAQKYYRNSLNLLRKCKPEVVLSEGEGITANQLMEIIRSKTGSAK